MSRGEIASVVNALSDALVVLRSADPPTKLRSTRGSACASSTSLASGFVRTWPARTALRELFEPTGVTIDTGGNVLFTDADTCALRWPRLAMPSNEEVPKRNADDQYAGGC